MKDKFNKKIFNYTNYFALACITPIGYFAPLGEWLLISFLSISTLIFILIDKTTISYTNLLIFIISILTILISFFWSISPQRTSEVMGPISGIIIAIFITLNITSNNKVINIENLIGIPLIFTSICILIDVVFNAEIRSNLATLVGDEPTSKSANFSRGIIILTMIMPLSVAMYINKGKKFLGLGVLLLIAIIVMLGPNHSSKIALLCALLSSIIIYIFGPRSFMFFGIISAIFMLSLPIISIKILPKLSHIKINYENTKPCTPERLASIHVERIPGTNKCVKNMEWQETSMGGSIIHRLLVWEFVGNEIYKKPLLGHGAGTSRLIGQNIVLNVPHTNLDIKGGIPLHPHNNFLEIWLELGLLGISVITLLWIKIIKYGINIRKESYIMGTGICTSIVTIFVMSNISFGVFQAWWMSSIALIFLVILQSFSLTKTKLIG